MEGVSVHCALSILQFPQVEETLSEPRVGPVQTRAPDGLTEKTNTHKEFRKLINNHQHQHTNKTPKTRMNTSRAREEVK